MLLQLIYCIYVYHIISIMPFPYISARKHISYNLSRSCSYPFRTGAPLYLVLDMCELNASKLSDLIRSKTERQTRQWRSLLHALSRRCGSNLHSGLPSRQWRSVALETGFAEILSENLASDVQGFSVGTVRTIEWLECNDSREIVQRPKTHKHKGTMWNTWTYSGATPQPVSIVKYWTELGFQTK